MDINQLLATLNSHQAAYINMDLPNPQNGDYMLSCFHLIP